MQIDMVAKEFSLTPSLREYLERRLRSAFSPARKKIVNIAVRMRDLNGPRGGCDMQCQVSVTMPGKPEIVVKEVQENMYNAIDRAVKRAAYRVARIAKKGSQAARRTAHPVNLPETVAGDEAVQSEKTQVLHS